jgi:hypothetical protein
VLVISHSLFFCKFYSFVVVQKPFYDLVRYMIVKVMYVQTVHMIPRQVVVFAWGTKRALLLVVETMAEPSMLRTYVK